MEKINLAVLFGGMSPEHDVSLNSAYSIISNMDMDKYNLVPVGITRTGLWRLICDEDFSQVQDGSWETNSRNPSCAILPEHGAGLLVFDNPQRYIHIDCVFPVMHGENGEDGAIQGFLKTAGLPCVGSGLSASCLSMDKALTHALTRDIVSQAKKLVFSFEGQVFDPEKTAASIEGELDYPLFIKPARSGSSIGISKVKRREELAPAVSLALKYDRKILAEEFIGGKEVEVSVLGWNNPIASVCGEIIPAGEFYTYDAKYNNMDSVLKIPAEIPDDSAERVRETAIAIFTRLECRGMARVDYFVKPCGTVIFNEINTIPGFTDISMYAKMLESSGIPYITLIDKLVEIALDK